MDEQAVSNAAQNAADTAQQGADAAGAAADTAPALTSTPTDMTDISGWGQWFQDNSDTLVSYGVKVVGVLVVLFVGWIIAGWVARITAKALRKARLDETLTRFISKMVRWAILLFVVLGCLGVFGVDVTSFAVVLGAAGFAIGMAFQGSLSNLAAGVMLLVFRPFKVDDVVSVGGVTGKVYEIELFSTILDTPDNRRMIMPNSQIFGSVIENITHHPIRRVDVAVGVEYSADLDETRRVLTDAASKHHDASTGKDFQVYCSELGASSVDYVLRVWAPTADYWAVREQLTETVKKSLDAAGIGIPFPQMDVHLDQLQTSE
jgi:small conductance mechanosensitive channel